MQRGVATSHHQQATKSAPWALFLGRVIRGHQRQRQNATAAHVLVSGPLWCIAVFDFSNLECPAPFLFFRPKVAAKVCPAPSLLRFGAKCCVPAVRTTCYFSATGRYFAGNVPSTFGNGSPTKKPNAQHPTPNGVLTAYRVPYQRTPPKGGEYGTYVTGTIYQNVLVRKKYGTVRRYVCI